MDKQLHELALSIQQKEELIQELARNEAEAKHLTLQYESRMLELEAEVIEILYLMQIIMLPKLLPHVCCSKLCKSRDDVKKNKIHMYR